MILNLSAENDVNQTSLKKLENLIQKTTVLFNHASWCGHCHVFRPEWEKFKEQMGGNKVNFVEIESSALGKIRENKTMYKKITPADGAVYFPMIIIFIKKGDKMEKKLYEGNRDSMSLKTFVESKTKVAKATKPKTTTPKKKATKSKTTSSSRNDGPLKNLEGFSLMDLNKQLDEQIINYKNNY